MPQSSDLRQQVAATISPQDLPLTSVFEMRPAPVAEYFDNIGTAAAKNTLGLMLGPLAINIKAIEPQIKEAMSKHLPPESKGALDNLSIDDDALFTLCSALMDDKTPSGEQ